MTLMDTTGCSDWRAIADVQREAAVASQESADREAEAMIIRIREKADLERRFTEAVERQVHERKARVRARRARQARRTSAV